MGDVKGLTSRSFIVTDIDERSVRFAKENVARNGLQNRITVELVDPDGPIFPPQVLAETDFARYVGRIQCHVIS